LVLLIGLLLWACAGGMRAQTDNVESTTPESSTSASSPEIRSSRIEEIVRFGQDVHLKTNETAGIVVVIFGNALIEGDVEENLVVIGGNLTLKGHVGEEMVVVLGEAVLDQNAKVDGQVVVVGGNLNADPGAVIQGERVEVGFLRIPGVGELKNWITKGLLMARPLPPSSGMMWSIAGIFTLLYLFLSVLFPRPLQATVTALESRPMSAFALGVLSLILVGPLVFLLMVSMIGILAIPFLICALFAAFLLGKAAVFCYLGRQFGRQLNIQFFQAPLPSLLLGILIIYLLYTIPVLGFLVWGLITPLAVGAVICACFGLLEREERPAAAPRTAPPLISTSTPADPLPGNPSAAVIDASSLPRAGFWLRFAATFLDLMLVMFLLAMIIQVRPQLFFVLWTAYHFAMWAWKGTTIGGIILGLKVVRLDGQPLTASVALVRALTSFLSALALFIGFFWAGWDRERQSWHDKIAGTTIVRCPKGTPLVVF